MPLLGRTAGDMIGNGGGGVTRSKGPHGGIKRACQSEDIASVR